MEGMGSSPIPSIIIMDFQSYTNKTLNLIFISLNIVHLITIDNNKYIILLM